MVNLAELVAFCVDEIGLDGPDGCTLQRLWTLITDRFPSKVHLTPGLKQNIWRSLVQLSQRSCLRFVPSLDKAGVNAARAEQDEVVIVASNVVQFRSMGVLDVEWMSKGVLAVLFLIAKSRDEGILMSDLSARILASGVSSGKGSSNYRVDMLVKHELVEKHLELRAHTKENRMRLKRFVFEVREHSPLGYPPIFRTAYDRCVEAMKYIYANTSWNKVVLVDLFDLIELEGIEEDGAFPMMRKRKVFQAYLEKLWQAGESLIELQRFSAYCVNRNLAEEALVRGEVGNSVSGLNVSKEGAESCSRRATKIFRSQLTAVLHEKPFARGRDGSTSVQREQRVQINRSYVEKHLGGRSAGLVWGESVPDQAQEIIRRAGATGATIADLSSLLHMNHREAGRLGNRLLALDESLSSRKDLGTVDAGNNRTSHMYIVSSDPRATNVPEALETPLSLSKQERRQQQAIELVKKHKIYKLSLLLKALRNAESTDEPLQSMLSRRTLMNLMEGTDFLSKRAVDVEGSAPMYKSDILYWDPTRINPTVDDFREALLVSAPRQRTAKKTAQPDALSQDSGSVKDVPPLKRVVSWADFANLVKDRSESEPQSSPLSFSATDVERKKRYKELRNAYPLGKTVMKRLQHMHRGLWRLATSSQGSEDQVEEILFTVNTFARQLLLSDLLRFASLADRHKIPVRVLSQLKSAADAGLKLEDLNESVWHVVGPPSNFEVMVQLLVSLRSAKWKKDHSSFSLTGVGWCPRRCNILCDIDEALNHIHELNSLESVDKFHEALKEFAMFFYTKSPTSRIPTSHEWLESGRWGLRAVDIASMRRQVARSAAVTKKLLKSRAVTTLMETVDVPGQALSNEGYSSTDETTYPDEDKAEWKDDLEDEDSSVNTAEKPVEDGAAIDSVAGGSRLSKIASLFEGKTNLVEFKEKFGKRVYVSLKYVLEIDVGEDAEQATPNGLKPKKRNEKQLEDANVQDWVLRQRCFRVLQCKENNLDTEMIRKFLRPFKDTAVRRCLQDMAERGQLASLHLSKNDVMTVLYDGKHEKSTVIVLKECGDRSGLIHPRMTRALDEWDEKLSFFQPLNLPRNESHAVFIEPEAGAQDVTDMRCFSLIAGMMSGSVKIDAVLEDSPIEQAESVRSAPKEAVHNIKRFDHISKLQAWTASKRRGLGRESQYPESTTSTSAAKKRRTSQACKGPRKRQRGEPRDSSRGANETHRDVSVNSLRKKILSGLLRRGAMGMNIESVVESPSHQEALDRLLLEEKVIKVPCDDHYRLICMEFQENWQPNWKWLNPDGSVGWGLKSKMLRAIFSSIFFAPFVQRKTLEERFDTCIAKVEMDALLEELIKKHKVVMQHEDGSYVAAMENLLGIDALRETSAPS